MEVLSRNVLVVSSLRAVFFTSLPSGPVFSSARPSNIHFQTPSIPSSSSQQQQFPQSLDTAMPSTTSTDHTQFSDATSPYLTSTQSKPMSIPRPQQQLTGLGSQMTTDYGTLGGGTYSISPSAFLNSTPDPSKDRDSIAMELGTPPTVGNFPLKSEMQMVMEQSCSQALPRPQQSTSQYLPNQQYPHTPHAPLYTSKSSPAILSPVVADESLISQLLVGTTPSQQQPMVHTSPPSVPPVHFNISPVIQSSSQPVFTYPQPSGQHPPASQAQQGYGTATKDSGDYAYNTSISAPAPPLPDNHPVQRVSLEYHKPSQDGFRSRRRSNEFHQRQKAHAQHRQTQADMYQQPKGSESTKYPQGNMDFLAEQMKNLEHQQLEHLREIEKQQSLATQQYLQLLQQYISQTSQEQQQVLQSALSDPNSVEILKTILLEVQAGSGSEGGRSQDNQGLTPEPSSLSASNEPLRKVLKVEDPVDTQPTCAVPGILSPDLATVRESTNPLRFTVLNTCTCWLTVFV